VTGSSTSRVHTLAEESETPNSPAIRLNGQPFALSALAIRFSLGFAMRTHVRMTIGCRG
jgi:hypothetical protein